MGTPTTAEVHDATEHVLDRISVRPPYFALEDLQEVAPGLVTARVPNSAPVLPEVGAIEAAQVARHLAILGSCAAASAREDDARQHYLAVEARYLRAADAPTTPIDEPLLGVAHATWIGKREARALIRLSTESGRDLNALEVTYAVMAPRMFERLHPPVEATAAPSSGDIDLTSPDPAAALGANTLAVQKVTATDDGVEVDCGLIDAATCAGHFPGLPAAPVAVVMGRLCHTAALAMNSHLGIDADYRIESGHVSANKLAQAGQRLTLQARYSEKIGEHHVVKGRAFADGDLVGEVSVVLSAHPIAGSTDPASTPPC